MTASAETLNPAGRPRPATRGLTALHLLAVAAVVAVLPFVPGFHNLRLLPFLILTVLVLAGELSSSGEGMVVSGGFLGLVVAEVVLGPGPAALIGALAITGALIRVRSSPRVYLNNLVNYTWCPLIAGTVLLLGGKGSGSRRQPGLVLRAGRHGVSRDARGQLRHCRGLCQLHRTLVAGPGRGQDVGPDAPGRTGVRADDRRGGVRHRPGRYRRAAAVGDRAGRALVPVQRAAHLTPPSRRAAADRDDRRAHRARQPRALERRDRRPHPGGDRTGWPRRAAADGSRPLQGDQRHARAPVWRRGPP